MLESITNQTNADQHRLGKAKGRIVNEPRTRLQQQVLLENFAQRCPARSAKRQGESVIQLHEHISCGGQRELNYMIKIHDRVPVNSEEQSWVENGLYVLHCGADQMRSTGRMHSNIVAKRLEPQNIPDFY